MKKIAWASFHVIGLINIIWLSYLIRNLDNIALPEATYQQKYVGKIGLIAMIMFIIIATIIIMYRHHKASIHKQ